MAIHADPPFRRRRHGYIWQEEACHEAVLGTMARATADARYDPLLALKCSAEIVSCATEGIVSGGGRVHACLRRAVWMLCFPFCLLAQLACPVLSFRTSRLSFFP